MQASTSLPVFKRRASLFYDDDEGIQKIDNKKHKQKYNLTFLS